MPADGVAANRPDDDSVIRLRQLICQLRRKLVGQPAIVSGFGTCSRRALNRCVYQVFNRRPRSQRLMNQLEVID